MAVGKAFWMKVGPEMVLVVILHQKATRPGLSHVKFEYQVFLDHPIVHSEHFSALNRIWFGSIDTLLLKSWLRDEVPEVYPVRGIVEVARKGCFIAE